MKKNKKIRKFSILLMICLFFAPNLMNSAQAADVKSGSVSIPITTGLIGSGNAAKTFYLDPPSGVNSASIQTGTFRYSGNNSLNGTITVENGKIKVTLKGNEKVETFKVTGANGNDLTKVFRTIPGNSIWRYADGRRWQINDYDQDRGVNKTKNVNAIDFATPSDVPPKTTVTTKSDPVNPSQATWFRDNVNTVPYSSIIKSSIKLNPLDLEGDTGKVGQKDGKFIVTYQVPSSAFSEEKVSDQFDKGAWVTGRLYYITLPYYFTAEAKMTTYSYGGTVNFEYSLPDQVTLNASATLIQPNPNPTKMTGDKVAVKINVKGELLSYTDTSNISEWVFYAREKEIAVADMKKEYSKVLTANKDFDFEIPASKLKGKDNYKQDYVLRVVVRFKNPVQTKTGPISSLEASPEISAGVYKKDPPDDLFPPPPNPPAKPEGKPPIARISAPKYIKAGDDMLVNGSGSSDPDGYITDYAWGTQGSQVGIGNTPKGYVWYTRDDVGQTFPISLTVVDNDGQIGSTSTEVTVIEPIPAAIINISGTLKQNRKTTLTNRSQSPTRFPLDPSKTQVTISAISGGANADIKYSGTLAGLESIDVLFKNAGKYKAKIYVENTLGYSASNEIIFDIVPDELPFAYFGMPGKVYRDPSNGNKAVVSIDDMSFSKDKDPLIRRIWEYRYDSDNNGSFVGESWVRFNEENRTRLNLELYQVGKYEIRLTVLEEFGQPTIEEFVTEDDRKWINSDSTQNLIERIVEVENRAPEVDWDL
jgi:hypothetical protein